MPVTQHRFDAVIRHIGRMVHEGALGKLTMVRAHLECLRPKDYYRESDWRGTWAREGGSVLINQAYHVIDLILWLAGRVKSISSAMATLSNADVMETEDSFSAYLTFKFGALGNVTVNGASGSQWLSYVEVSGTGGTIAFDIGYPNIIHRFQLNNKRAMQEWKRRLKEASESRTLPPPNLAYYGISHRDQVRAFANAILGIIDYAGATLEEAFETVNLIECLYRSARSGQTVEMANDN